MKRISQEQAQDKREFKREEHRPYSSKALRGPSYFTVEKGADGFDKVTYYTE